MPRRDGELYPGDRVELALHLDRWMQGDRYGEVTRAGALTSCVFVRLDKSGDEVQVSVYNLTLVP